MLGRLGLIILIVRRRPFNSYGRGSTMVLGPLILQACEATETVTIDAIPEG